MVADTTTRGRRAGWLNRRAQAIVWRWLLLPLLAVLLSAPAVGAQDGQRRAGLVVQFGDGRVETACVRFPEEEISGLELLERSGLPVIAQVSGMGAAVCKIGPDGCDYPAEGCFCKRDGARAIYWAYYLREGDAWVYSNRSAGGVRVRDGAVQGWAWGLGDSGSGATPPLVGIDAICGAAAPPAVPEPVPTAAPPTAAPPTVAPSPHPPTAAPLPSATAARPSPPATLPPTPGEAAQGSPASIASATPEAPTSLPPSATAERSSPTTVPTVTAEPPSPTTTLTATAEPAATAIPSPAPAAGGASPRDSTDTPAFPSSYLGFAALALILGAGVVAAARRR